MLIERAINRMVGQRRAGLEIGMVAGDQTFHGFHPVAQAAGELVEFLQQGLVAIGEGGGGLPLGDVMQHDPGQADEDRAKGDDGDDDILHRLSPPCRC
jgi:hypothetical protein